MKINYWLFSLLFTLNFAAQEGSSVLPLIPYPQQLNRTEGNFTLTANVCFYAEDTRVLADMAYFNNYLQSKFGFSLKQTRNPFEKNCVKLERLQGKAIDTRGAYQLLITPAKCLIKGDSLGVFYALQTLIQLMNAQKNPEILLPCLNVSDQPSFAWRGMHLDVSRHFFSVDFIKHYIDLLALYKLNTFHWHLTDDQGWRIEIKKYPQLTTKGAYRNGSMIGKYSDQKFDTLLYGGYYTQEDIKDVVNYASQRHITIVPEIEMPGHARAAISSYPYLSCNGKPIDVAKSWGVFDEVFCTKDSVFTFLENVLSEVMSLFPGKYIHIGGDECPKTSWKKCATCQSRIQSEHLKEEHELQSYFIRRIEKFVNQNGKQILGWDEILEGGLAPNATVMSWRGTEGGVQAARQQHHVVMSPGKPCYFDHYQSRNISSEPLAIGGYNPLDSVYAYQPVPPGLSEKERAYILGAQANVWTEYILTPAQVEYMALPRLCALSEVLWTNSKQRDFNDFVKRLGAHSALLDLWQVNYARHFLNIKTR